MSWGNDPQIPREWLMAGVLGGALAGVLYALSPLTLIVLVGAVFLVRWFARDLPEREYRWFIGILIAAFALRLLAVAALFLTSPHDTQAAAMLFGDENYTLYRSWRMRDALVGVPMLKYDYLIANDSYGRSNYLTAIAFVQLLVGPAPYALRLLNALVFIGAMLLFFRVMRRAFGTVVAFGGLTVLLFLPTLFFWSISLLKEPFYFVLTVVVLAAAIECVRNPVWLKRAAAAGAGAACLWMLHDLRTGAVSETIAGLALGFAGWSVAFKGWRRASVIAAAVVVALVLAASPSLQARVVTNINFAATLHTGHVFTVGHAYKLLDEPFYVTPVALPPYTLTAGEMTRFVVRAFGSYLLVPLPWQINTAGELVYLPEQIVWYLLMALAIVGLPAAYRRDPLVTCLLVGSLIPTAIVVAMTTGNVGTLIRHRTLIVPFLVWLSAVGWCALAERLRPEGSR
jgi:hypothetical protein